MLRHQPHDHPTGGLFAVCSGKDIAAIRRAGTEVTVPAGTVIHAPGQRADWAYVILEGLALAADGNHRTSLGPGDVHGDRALLAREPWCHELVAVSAVRLLVIDRRRFNALMNERAAFAHGIARQLAG